MFAALIDVKNAHCCRVVLGSHFPILRLFEKKGRAKMRGKIGGDFFGPTKQSFSRSVA